MKNKFSFKIPIIVLIVFIFCIFLGSLFHNLFNDNKVNVQDGSNNKNNFAFNEDGTVTLGSGMVANGFYDIETNKIINPGSLIKPVNGKIQGQVSFKQNISERKNYLLIIMIDYNQYDFIVNDNTYSTFPFSLEGEDGLRINVEITNLSSDAHEFSYFIVSEPDINQLSIENSNEWSKLLMTRNLYCWRLLLNDSSNNIKIPEYDKSYIKMDSQKNYNIQLTKTHQAVDAMPSCTSMEDVELVLGNINNYDMEYVLIAFLDWKQIPINNNDMTKLVNIPSQSTIYFKLNIPYVEENTPYQIFAIPKPFSDDLKISIPPFCTLRTIVKPK